MDACLAVDGWTEVWHGVCVKSYYCMQQVAAGKTKTAWEEPERRESAAEDSGSAEETPSIHTFLRSIISLHTELKNTSDRDLTSVVFTVSSQRGKCKDFLWYASQTHFPDKLQNRKYHVWGSEASLLLALYEVKFFNHLQKCFSIYSVMWRWVVQGIISCCDQQLFSSFPVSLFDPMFDKMSANGD